MKCCCAVCLVCAVLLHRIIVSYLSGGLSVCKVMLQFDSVVVFQYYSVQYSVFQYSVCKVQCSVFQCSTSSVAACLVCKGWAEHKVVIPANFTF